MTEIATEAAPSPTAPASLWEDFLDIFYSPREVFERRRYAGFGVVLLVITLVIAALYFASQGPLADVFADEFRRGMARAGAAGREMSPEQMAGARRTAMIFGMGAILVAFPLGVVLIGVILWALAKPFGSVATAKMAILVVTYAQFPRVLQSATGILQGLLLHPRTLASTSLGPARFFDPDSTSAVVMGLLLRMDVFYIWSTVLIAIGIHVLGRVPKTQSYLLAVLVWLAGAIPPLVGGMMAGQGR